MDKLCKLYDTEKVSFKNDAQKLKLHYLLIVNGMIISNQVLKELRSIIMDNDYLRYIIIFGEVEDDRSKMHVPFRLDNDTIYLCINPITIVYALIIFLIQVESIYTTPYLKNVSIYKIMLTIQQYTVSLFFKTIKELVYRLDSYTQSDRVLFKEMFVDMVDREGRIPLHLLIVDSPSFLYSFVSFFMDCIPNLNKESEPEPFVDTMNMRQLQSVFDTALFNKGLPLDFTTILRKFFIDKYRDSQSISIPPVMTTQFLQPIVSIDDNNKIPELIATTSVFILSKIPLDTEVRQLNLRSYLWKQNEFSYYSSKCIICPSIVCDITGYRPRVYNIKGQLLFSLFLSNIKLYKTCVSNPSVLNLMVFLSSTVFVEAKVLPLSFLYFLTVFFENDQEIMIERIMSILNDEQKRDSVERVIALICNISSGELTNDNIRQLESIYLNLLTAAGIIDIMQLFIDDDDDTLQAFNIYMRSVDGHSYSLFRQYYCDELQPYIKMWKGVMEEFKQEEDRISRIADLNPLVTEDKVNTFIAKYNQCITQRNRIISDTLTSMRDVLHN